MDADWLKSIVNDDDLGLLAIKTKNAAPTADEHLLTKFSEINNFVAMNGSEPKADMTNVPEYMLHQRLNAIRNNPEHIEALQQTDEHGLLKEGKAGNVKEPKPEYAAQQKEINSLDDIFADDELGLLDDGSDSIFTLKHVSKERLSPEHVSRRKKCADFTTFKPIFDAHHKALKEGAMKKIRFQSELQINKGEVFLIDGMLVYIANIGNKQKKNFGNVNARLYCVFDNGTESNMYLRSLAAAMWKDPASGQIVDMKQPDFVNQYQQVTGEDQSTGFIYVLKSLSKNPEIQNINNLYKIGYSTTPIEKRLANAENEPTYLMAAVKEVVSYQCFNMNAQKFENLLHTFFGNSCLDIQVADSNGKLCQPREWFIAPIEAIQLAVQLMINGEIIHYRYDSTFEEVIER